MARERERGSGCIRLTGRIKDGDEAEVDVEDGKVVVKHLNRTPSDIPELASAGR